MGNVEMESNGRRGRQEPITMRSLHREVESYREYNEKIMKSQEEILQSLNMLHRQANKDSGTKKVDSDRHVTTSKSHRRRDEHGNDRNSRRMSRWPSFPKSITRRAHKISMPGRNPSVSPIRRQRRRPEENILQVNSRK
jgi:hypothetical protein